MSDMPERIVCNPERRSWRNANGSGKGKKVETPRTEYIRADITDQLATTLEECEEIFAHSFISTHREKIKTTLATYRKAKGE